MNFDFQTKKTFDMKFQKINHIITYKNANRIGARDVITVMRSLGTYPTKKEIENHLKTYDKKPGDDVEFSTFLNIM